MTARTNATQTTNLPITEKAALYIRQAEAAHPAMDKNVREGNTEALLQFAHKAGWTDDLLVIFQEHLRKHPMPDVRRVTVLQEA